MDQELHREFVVLCMGLLIEKSRSGLDIVILCLRQIGQVAILKAALRYSQMCRQESQENAIERAHDCVKHRDVQEAGDECVATNIADLQ